MSEHAVVIAGGGPTGMMLAAELTLAGTDVLVVERRASFQLESSRSRGLHNASYAGTWEIPVLGEVNAPSAALVRPDTGLRDALTTWFGP